MMKRIRFASHLVEPILSGEKAVTWRMFDDKCLSEGDVVVFVDAGTGAEFATARLISVIEKPLHAITAEDCAGHEAYGSLDEMLQTFRAYYGDAVNEHTMVKIVGFVCLMRVAGCVLRRDDSMLLLHRTARGWWETPGGKIEAGETASDAVAREAQEEIGCAVRVGEKLCEDVFVVDGFDIYGVWYACEPCDDPCIGEPDRFDRIAWIPMNAVGNYALSPAVEVLLARMIP